MTPERWERIESILPEARRRSGEERETYLAAACGDDSELRAELDSLLDAEGETTHGSDPLLPPTEPADELPPGRRIGSYRIERTLGKGGMGTVYLATRADREFEQEVALKILTRRLQGGSGVRRFRRERQILAQLEHPNIASLKDGGTTEDELPYFVMEYVEGEPIHRWAAYRGLGIEGRLGLIEKVCAAVHFFHQNLVLHRDLKPSNILVKEDGEPKILDFGIARLLEEDPDSPGEPRLVGPTPITPMTLAYASPEQLRGEPLSTASDIYALGILLYKLLAGRSPNFLAAEAEGRPAEDLWAPPVLPSHAPRAGDTGGAIPFPAKALAGDLDSIVLKALAERPGDRYASAQQLADDLRRFREGRPVEAREQTIPYRLGRFLRRHRLAAAAWLLASLLLVALTIRMKGLKELAEVRSVEKLVGLDFMVELFEASDVEDPDQPVEAADLLDRASRDFENRFRDQPAILATLRGAMGRAYLGLHRYEKAEPLLVGSLALREEIGAPAEDVATSAVNLARLYRAQSRREESTALARRAWELSRRQEPPGPVAGRAANLLARAMAREDRSAEAERLYRQSLAIWRKQEPRPHPELADALNDYGNFLRQRGRLEAAAEHLGESLAVYRRTGSPRGERAAIATAGLAAVHFARGQYDRAAELFAESEEARAELYPRDDPDRVPLLNSYGKTLARLGRRAEAMERYDEALRLLSLFPDSLRRGIVAHNKAELLLAEGRAEEAERWVTEALHSLEGSRAEAWRLRDAESLWGACLVATGDRGRGLELLEASHASLREDLGEAHHLVREAAQRLETYRSAP